VRIGRKAGAWDAFTPELLQVLLSQATLQEGSRIDSRGSMALVVDLIAGLAVVLAAEEVVETHFVEAGSGGVGGQVAANTGEVMIGADHHGGGVPPDDAADAKLQLLVAGERRFVLGRDGVDVRGLYRLGDTHVEEACLLQDLAHQEMRAVSTLVLDDVLEGLEPLVRFLRITVG
jgi:hypothetical protein